MGDAGGPGAAGPLRFDAWMADRLYGPDGFYTAVGAAGRVGGDFLTSPEVGPLFGALVARWIDGRWDDLGQPADFTVVEVGAGRGALANTVLRATPRCAGALRYVTVEASARLRDRQRELLGDRVEIRGDLPQRIGPGVVVANELLDNLPFRILERAGAGWTEVWVEGGRPERRSFVGPVPSWVPPAVPEGSRLPWCELAATWVEQARGAVDDGWVLCLDYGVERTSQLVARPWLRTYREHRRGVDPFVGPGPVDITTDVPLDQLPAPARVVTQADWLADLGIEELVDEGRRRWAERGPAPGLAALEGRSRVREAEALCDPTGLGAFLVVEWSAG